MSARRIIDRKKDLVKLQHGEYVSYGKTESVLKTAPIVENICAYADPSRDHIIAIIIPDKNQLANVNPEISVKVEFRIFRTQFNCICDHFFL